MLTGVERYRARQAQWAERAAAGVAGRPSPPDFTERFWARVDMSGGPDACPACRSVIAAEMRRLRAGGELRPGQHAIGWLRRRRERLARIAARAATLLLLLLAAGCGGPAAADAFALIFWLLAPGVPVVAFAWWLGRKERAMRLVVLELLRDGSARGGLELVQMSRGRLIRGLIYNVLHELQDAGLVDSIVDPDPSHPSRGGIPRRLYFLTARGVDRADEIAGASP